MAIEPVSITPGEGVQVAADTVGGNSYQYVKLDLGADGVSDPVSGQIPVDVTDLPAKLTAGAAGAPTDVIAVGGYDGTNVRYFKTGTDGRLEVVLPNTSVVSGTGTFTVVESARINASAAPFTSAARTASPTPFSVTNTYWRTARLYLNVTAAPTSTSETLQVVLYDDDPASATDVPISNFSAEAAANNAFWTSLPKTVVYDLGPNATAFAANWRADTKMLPPVFKIAIVHSGSTAWTYTVGLSLGL